MFNRKKIPKIPQEPPKSPLQKKLDNDLTTLKEDMNTFALIVRLERQLLRALVKRHPEVREDFPEEHRSVVDLWLDTDKEKGKE